jgi:hypothetical protein
MQTSSNSDEDRVDSYLEMNKMEWNRKEENIPKQK